MNMDSALIYSPLREEERSHLGWDKETVKLLLENKSKIYQQIKAFARRKGGKLLQQTELDDLYMNILDYAFRSDDYNINKAVSSDGERVVSIHGYVNSFIKFIVLKYISDSAASDSRTVSNIVDKEDNTVSIFDVIPSKTESESYVIDKLTDLDDICRQYEGQRYAYGLDLFEIWFVRVATMVYNKEDSYECILTSLGIKNSDMNTFKEMASVDQLMLSIAKAITVDLDGSLDVLRRYCYGSDRIEKAIIAAA